MNVVLINNQDKVKLDLKLLEKVSTYISDKFDKDKSCELNIIFTGKGEIKALNKKYRNVDKETDVLSFSYHKDKDLFGFEKDMDEFKDDYGFLTIGEIIICPEVAKENAIKQSGNWNLNLEIILLIIHGILHIYDYDHEEKEDRIRMESIQESMLNDVRSTFKL